MRNFAEIKTFTIFMQSFNSQMLSRKIFCCRQIYRSGNISIFFANFATLFAFVAVKLNARNAKRVAKFAKKKKFDKKYQRLDFFNFF